MMLSANTSLVTVLSSLNRDAWSDKHNKNVLAPLKHIAALLKHCLTKQMVDRNSPEWTVV